MTLLTSGSSEPPGPTGAGSLDLRGLFLTVWADRRRVLLATLVSATLAVGVAFLLPKWYTADTVILPPEENDMLRNLAFGQRALSRFPAFGVLSEYYTAADVSKAVLASRTIQAEIADRFHLATVYHKRSVEKTVKELRQHTKVKLNADGTIQVSVEDRDPRRAAAMANAYIELLDRFNVEKRNSQAKRTRQFLEGRVRDTDSLLRVSEAALRVYQERHHTIVPPSTANSADTQSAADLMARKLMLEVRLGVLRGYLREDNDQVVQTRNELDQLNARVGALPALQTELERMVRDNKVQEQLYLLLTAELEQARIQETQDTPTVSILDVAVPPERHSRPRKTLVGLGAGLLGLIGASIVATQRAPRPSDPRA